MTQQVSIDKGETITITNSNFGQISVNLNSVGEFVVVSNGPPVVVQQTSLDAGLKQEYIGESTHVKQTAVSGLKINGDLILGNITQSVRRQ